MLLCFTLEISAQKDAWPVQVNGSMLPPHSLNLKVYGLERSGDLTFQLLLKDPVEANLYVRPVISIEQNGSVIYQTDPNFGGEPILLSQFEQMLLNGSALEKYLSNTALIGAGANSTGSVDIPEGFNQICLQLYGVERNVPVSNKFCISGNFRLNQPPQIVKPTFNEKIKMAPVQNMIFSWQAMHLGSGNNPGPVEYLFEIVELPIGVMNANDVFESALRIYSSRTTATSLVYSPGEPVLEPNKYYAWRVTATSIMYPTSTLFQNDGRSEVSMFVLYDGEAPAGEINPFDNPSPRGCSVYETAYGPVAKADNEPMIAAPNQTVKLGYFSMKITEVSGSQQVGYSGKGLVEYPMLRSTLEVEFRNIKVNKEGRVYEAELIEAVTDPALAIDNRNISKANLEKRLSPQYFYKLETELKKPNKNVSGLSEGGTKMNSLPLELKFDKSSPGIKVIGLVFTPTNAYLNFVTQTEDGGVYAATLIPSTPHGIKNNSYLTPLNIAGIQRRPVKILESIETGVVLANNSKMNCDCKGFESLNDESQLSVSGTILSRADNNASVSFESVKKTAQYENNIIEVKNMPEFKVNGLNDYTFKAKSGTLDLDGSRNIFGNDLNAYATKQQNDWKGLRLNDVHVNIPEKYNFLNSKASIILDKGEMYIDNKELAYGNFYKTDVLSLSKGRMGPWMYSIDTMRVSMDKKHVGNFNLTGKIKTPFFDDHFPYAGVVKDGIKNQIKMEAVIPNTKLGMSIWHGNFNSAKPSEVDAQLIKVENEKQFAPKGSFYGDLAIQFSDQEFRDAILNPNKGETIDALKKALKIDNLNFDLSKLKIDGLISDPYKEKNKRYKAENFDVNNVSLTVGGSSNKLSDASIVFTAEEKKERLGLKTTIIKESSKIELTIWAVSHGESFKFEGVEVNNIDLKCNCGVAEVIPDKESWNKILEDFYDKNKSISQSKYTQGSLMSVEKNLLEKLTKEISLKEINDLSIAWFPRLIDNGPLNIPFLDRNLNIENKGGSYVGKNRNGKVIDDNTVWTKEIYESLSNEVNGDLNLPIIITEELWSKFGFKGDYALPDNFKLFISEFKTSGNDKLSNATIKVGLVGALTVDGKEVFIYFGSNNNIAIGPDKVAFQDVLMHLGKDTKLDDRVTYLSSEGRDTNGDAGSFVRLDCTQGVNNFNLQGSFTAIQNTLINISEKNSASPKPTVFGFKLIEDQIADNDELLAGFIAPLKNTFKENKIWKPWTFSTEDAQHISFSGANSFEAYLDYSSNKAVSATEQDKNSLDEFMKIRLFSEYFKGIVFNKMEFNIPMLELKGSENKSKAETFKDVIKMAFYEIESEGFFASYQGLNKVPKENLARLGGWSYHLDTISFNFEYNSLDEEKLMLKGATQIPIFRQAPDKDNNKWKEKFTDAWVPYKLNIEYNIKDESPEISGSVEGIEESLFELNYIQGLGMKLDEESSIDFIFDSDENRLIARANLNGRAIYYIESLDAAIRLLKFQNFNINYNGTGLCRSNDIAGIESIDFGTWSIVEFSDLEKLALEKAKNSATGQKAIGKVKENKFAKGIGDKIDKLNELASFEINIHEPTFACTGSEWKLFIGLDLSIVRDKENLTAAQQVAYDKFNPAEAATNKKSEAEVQLKPLEDEYRSSQNNIKSIASERTKLQKEKNDLQLVIKSKASGKNDRSTEITGHKTRIADYEKKIAELDKKYKEALAAVKEKYEPFKAQKSILKEATREHDKQTKMVVESKKKYDESSVGERLKIDKETIKDQFKEAKATKTGAFSASGDIEVAFDSKGFKSVALTCLEMGGEFGPLKFNGGINFFRDESTTANYDPSAKQTAWGTGLLGMINLSVLDYEFASKFQTGVKLGGSASAVDEFRYFFADLSFSGDPGIPLGQSSFALSGVGGGFYYNMVRNDLDFDKVNKKAPPAVADNDRCKAEGLKAGESLSGFTYKVSQGGLGGYLSALITHPARVAVEGKLSLEMETNNGIRFRNIGFNLDAYALYEKLASRKTESTIIAKGNINLNFGENSNGNIRVIGGIDFRFGKKAGPLEIAAPEDKNSNPDSWNKVKFCFSKDLNYVHAGSWGIPGRSNGGPKSELNFLSAGFEAPLFGKRVAGLYAQIGDNTDGLPKIKYLLPDYKGTDNSLENSSVLTDRFGANAGFRFNAEMGNEFLIFKWNASADIGANLSIENRGEGVTCNGKKQKVGFENGYYLTGNAYASLQATASIDTWVKEFEIFDGSVDLALDFGFPNPSYLLGDFAVEYSVLGGAFEGTQNMEIDLGTKPCDDYQTNPLVGIKAHHSFDFIDDLSGSNAILYAEVKTNVELEKEYKVRKEGSGGQILKCSLDVILKEKSSGKIIPFVNRNYWKDKLRDVSMLPMHLMKPNKSYIIEAKYTWTSKPFVENSFVSVTTNAVTIGEEIVTKEFKTSPLWGIYVHQGIELVENERRSDMLFRNMDSIAVIHKFDFSKEKLLETEDNSREYLGFELDVAVVETDSGNEVSRLDKINEKVKKDDDGNFSSVFKNTELLKSNTNYTVNAKYKFRTYNKSATGEEINIKKLDDQIVTTAFKTSPFYDIKAHNDFVFPENGGFIIRTEDTFKIRHNMASYRGNLDLASVIITEKLTNKVVKTYKTFIEDSIKNDMLYFRPNFYMEPNTAYTLEAQYIERYGSPLNDNIKEVVRCDYATSPAYNKEIHNSFDIGNFGNELVSGYKKRTVYKDDKGRFTAWLHLDSLRLVHNMNVDEVFKLDLDKKVIYIKCDLAVTLEDLASGKAIPLQKGNNYNARVDFRYTNYWETPNLSSYLLSQKLEANKTYLIRTKYNLYSYQMTEAGQMFNKQPIKEEVVEGTLITSQFYGSSAFKELEVVDLPKPGWYTTPDIVRLKHNYFINSEIKLNDGTKMMITPKLRIRDKLTKETIPYSPDKSLDNLTYKIKYSKNFKPNSTYLIEGSHVWFHLDYAFDESFYMEFTIKDEDLKAKEEDLHVKEEDLKAKYDDANIVAKGGIAEPIYNLMVRTNFDQIKIKHNADIEKERFVLSDDKKPKFMKCNLVVTLKEKLSGIVVPIKYEEGKNVPGSNNSRFTSTFKITEELKLNKTYIIEVKYNWTQYDKSEAGVVSNEKVVREESESSEFTTVDKPSDNVHNEFIFPKEGETINSNSTEIKFRHNAVMGTEIMVDKGNSIQYSIATAEIQQRGSPNRIKIGKPTKEENGLVTVIPINAPGFKPNTTYNLTIEYAKKHIKRDSSGLEMTSGKSEWQIIQFKTGD